MPRFSANLGFLWTGLDLPRAVHAAAKAGFDAVECHWPHDTPPKSLRAALDATGLPLLGLNTTRGDHEKGDFGLSAVPGREAEARDAIDAALAYAEIAGAEAVHVMAGTAEGRAAEKTFRDNLEYACDRARGRMILIESINPFDAPGYFLQSPDHARRVIADVRAPNLRMMFDCYHVGRLGQDVLTQLNDVFEHVGHIQFAAVPDRGPPDHGTLDYSVLFRELDALGWQRPLGAEYRPGGDTDASLGWLARTKAL
ncbi:hydroxypyruvate isomerase family protein [Roseovarius sp.]|uniref:hydroxypyruvate isomerase family protein n=1 Tax=Roseovarius sp. TaxID=1486281 RepID=UPI003D12761D